MGPASKKKKNSVTYVPDRSKTVAIGNRFTVKKRETTVRPFTLELSVSNSRSSTPANASASAKNDLPDILTQTSFSGEFQSNGSRLPCLSSSQQTDATAVSQVTGHQSVPADAGDHSQEGSEHQSPSTKATNDRSIRRSESSKEKHDLTGHQSISAGKENTPTRNQSPNEEFSSPTFSSRSSGVRKQTRKSDVTLEKSNLGRKADDHRKLETTKQDERDIHSDELPQDKELCSSREVSYNLDASARKLQRINEEAEFTGGDQQESSSEHVEGGSNASINTRQSSAENRNSQICHEPDVSVEHFLEPPTVESEPSGQTSRRTLSNQLSSSFGFSHRSSVSSSQMRLSLSTAARPLARPKPTKPVVPRARRSMADNVPPQDDVVVRVMRCDSPSSPDGKTKRVRPTASNVIELNVIMATVEDLFSRFSESGLKNSNAEVKRFSSVVDNTLSKLRKLSNTSITIGRANKQIQKVQGKVRRKRKELLSLQQEHCRFEAEVAAAKKKMPDRDKLATEQEIKKFLSQLRRLQG